MRNLLVVSVSLLSLSLVACSGGTAPEQSPEATEQQQGLNQTGDGCSDDSECPSGPCWHEADSYPIYNPYWIRASQCTEECGAEDNDAYCQQLAADLGAPYAAQARCIPARGVYDDYPYDDIFYVCDLIPAGLGNVAWVE